MRTFIDFEFIENGNEHPIIPVSIGMVREDEAKYYAEFKGVDWSKANEWVLINVKPYIGPPSDHKSKEDIIKEIVEFVGEEPEIWTYFGSYDWVVLCQLFGTMVDLPESWPMFCLDLRQWMWHLDLDRGQINIDNTTPHQAISDAIWNKKLFDYLVRYQLGKFTLDY